MEKKMAIPIEYLCLDTPGKFVFHYLIVEFATYMHYCRTLKFEDRPDYTFLKKNFKELMAKENIEYDYVFDWTSVEAPKRHSIYPGQVSGRPRIFFQA